MNAENITHMITIDWELILAIAGLCISIVSGAILMAWTVRGKLTSLETHFDALAAVFQRFDTSNKEKHQEIIDSSSRKHDVIIDILKRGEERFDDHGNRIATLEERTKDGC